MAPLASVAATIEQEELIEERVVAAKPRRQQAAVPALLAAVASAVGAATLVGGGSFLLARHFAGLPPPEPQITVRALLASDELADITTDNLMALHSGGAVAASGREHVRGQVARGLMQVDAALEQLDPVAHRQIGSLKLSTDQRQAALHVLRKFGDSRMVGLSRAISSAVNENHIAAGDDSSLQRRLTDVLQTRLGDLVQLNSEMFPGAAVDAAMIAHGQSSKGEIGTLSDAAARRLFALDGVSGGVNAHAQALFESLEHQMPEQMPKAPARMLGLFGPAQQQPAGGTDQQKNQKFMECVKAAMPDPTKFVKCIVDNLEHVVKMVMDFVSGNSGNKKA